MTYAFVQDIASNWEHYERFAGATIDPSRTNPILHLAGPTEEGFRTIEVWETEQAWQSFQAERLKPAIAALGGPARPRQSPSRHPPPHPTVQPRPGHVQGSVQGARPSRSDLVTDDAGAITRRISRRRHPTVRIVNVAAVL